MKLRCGDVVCVWLLSCYTCALQADLYLPPVNTIARRVPTVLSTFGSIAFFASVSLNRVNVSFKELLIYYYLVITTFSLMLFQMIRLFEDLHGSIDEFRSSYRFPSWLCYTIVFTAATVLLGVPPMMLLVKGRTTRARCALIIWSFNALDGAVFESNTVVNTCYTTSQMLYENVLYGVLFYYSARVTMPDWLPW